METNAFVRLAMFLLMEPVLFLILLFQFPFLSPTLELPRHANMIQLEHQERPHLELLHLELLLLLLTHLEQPHLEQNHLELALLLLTHQLLLTLFIAVRMHMTMVWEYAFASQAFTNHKANALKEHHVVQTLNVLLMVLVHATKVSRTMMGFVLNVLLELSGALLQASVFLFVDKILSSIKLLKPANVSKDLD